VDCNSVDWQNRAQFFALALTFTGPEIRVLHTEIPGAGYCFALNLSEAFQNAVNNLLGLFSRAGWRSEMKHVTFNLCLSVALCLPATMGFAQTNTPYIVEMADRSNPSVHSRWLPAPQYGDVLTQRDERCLPPT